MKVISDNRFYHYPTEIFQPVSSTNDRSKSGRSTINDEATSENGAPRVNCRRLVWPDPKKGYVEQQTHMDSQQPDNTNITLMGRYELTTAKQCKHNTMHEKIHTNIITGSALNPTQCMRYYLM
ncbi:hypothetical protein XELAEV_18045161mg [Xenopus laevis]|uniref:Uncharacterized protein n=1 Tax=Xenopus laevis TaxID=8355 RepID=A0A974C070_XENLA|nr:hypothetical protein XELAEV_18045161mg [Xenopus laevis]